MTPERECLEAGRDAARAAGRRAVEKHRDALARLSDMPVPPITEVVELQDGGEVTLQRFEDGTHRITFDSGGMHLSFPVTSRDVQRIREATGALVLAGRLDVLR